MLSFHGKPAIKLDRVLEYLPSVNGKNPPVIWLGNNRLLLSGSTMYNIDNGSYIPLDPLVEINWLAAYAISPDRSKLAVHGNFPRGPQEVGFVDLTTQTYQRLFTADLPDDLFHPAFQVGWDGRGNLYFDFPEGTRPLIRKYDGMQVSTFLADATLESLSPQGTMLAWRRLRSVMPKVPQPQPKSVVLDLVSNKEVLTVGAHCESLWAADDRIAGLLNRETGMMHLYRTSPAELKTVKLPEGAAGTDFIRLTHEGIEAYVVTGPEGAKGLSRVVVPF
jgi:hypothetical protein